MVRLAWFLMQDYAGGTRQLYRGKHKPIAERRIRDLMAAGWPRSSFVIVTASSLAEAHAKAQARFAGELREPRPG